MKKIVTFLFSMFFSVMLLMMFAISIAYATFIENDYGTDTAQVLIYQSRWFEILLLIGAVNLIGSMFQYKLFSRKKWAIMLFHMAFVCMILGAGVTRYFGFEGSMHIREGESTNQVVSETSFISLKVSSNGEEVSEQTKVRFTPNSSNSYKKSITVGGKDIQVENELFVPNASETLVPDESGLPVISMIYSDGEMQRTEFLLMQNEKKEMGSASFGFETGESSATIVFSRTDEGLNMVCADTVLVSSMIGQTGEKLIPLVAYPVLENKFYVIGKSGFVLKNYLPKATPALVQRPMEAGQEGMDAFTAKITSGNEIRRVNVFGRDGVIFSPATCTINGINVSLSYGAVVRELPFSIFLRDFQLERYPGSNSPSSYASEITLKDPTLSIERPFRIFMNNVLKYNGYRFFQSSFDQDEKGTVLSVNQDYWGTLISYLGYFLMALGMVFTVFSKHSRFQALIRLSSKLQQKRQALKILVVGIISFDQIFDQAGNYRLNALVQQSYNKKQTLRNKLDKEIMNVDERVNICYQIFNGDFLKIFPIPNDERKTCVTHSALPKTMKKEEADFAGSILNLYYDEYNNSVRSGNWSKPDEYLGYIKKFQTTYGAEIIPSQTKIGLEILYNDWNIFGKLAKIYALLGFVLLVFHFMLIFKPAARFGKFINVC